MSDYPTLTISEAIKKLPEHGLNGIETNAQDLMDELLEAEEEAADEGQDNKALREVKVRIIRRKLRWMASRAMWEIAPVTILPDEEDEV